MWGSTGLKVSLLGLSPLIPICSPGLSYGHSFLPLPVQMGFCVSVRALVNMCVSASVSKCDCDYMSVSICMYEQMYKCACVCVRQCECKHRVSVGVGVGMWECEIGCAPLHSALGRLEG